MSEAEFERLLEAVRNGHRMDNRRRTFMAGPIRLSIRRQKPPTTMGWPGRLSRFRKAGTPLAEPMHRGKLLRSHAQQSTQVIDYIDGGRVRN